MLSIKVEVKKKLYYKNGWGLFGCEVVKESDKKLIEINSYGNFTIKGNMPELFEGTIYTVDLQDEIERSPKGDSYNVIQVHMPKNTSIKAQYDLLKNITTKTQYNNIIKVFPMSKKIKILDAIKNGEVDLSTVKGFAERNIKKLKNNIIAKEDNIYIYNKLIPIGVTQATVDTIIKHYKSSQTAIQRINESIYNLCEVKGLGFIKVDGYALLNGEDKEGFKRIEACINYIIHEQTKEGHSWTDIADMVEKASELLNINKYHIESFLGTLDMDDKTNILIVNEHQVTSKYYYRIEKEVYNNLKRLDDHYKIVIDERKMEKAIANAQESLGVTYTDEQLTTVTESFKHGVYIINGSAGTGKSTIMKGITEICTSLGLKYKAIALSGRAAQLLTLKGIAASTIHRLLKYDGVGFIHKHDNPLTQDVIILEEASMVNASLWYSIVTAMKSGSKLIIVGDSGQLSGIGNGDVLRDLLHNPKFTSRELKQIHRQAKDSGIIEVASNVREGESITGYNWEVNDAYGINKDMYVFTYKDKAKLHETAKRVIANRLAKTNRDNVMEFLILVSNKSKGELSAVSINKYCQSIYNKLNKPFVKNSTYEFKVSDKVIISGNKYKVHMYQSINDFHLQNPIMTFDEEVNDHIPLQHELYNGTMGIVEAINTTKDDESVLVKFEGFDGYIEISKDDLSDLDLAYATTVHRAQGVGVPSVLVLLDFGGFKLLSKQLLYTAITRASAKCIVLAENNALLRACKSDSSNLRKTFIGQLIREDK